jgi:hypothetical protein
MRAEGVAAVALGAQLSCGAGLQRLTRGMPVEHVVELGVFAEHIALMLTESLELGRVGAAFLSVVSAPRVRLWPSNSALAQQSCHQPPFRLRERRP